MEGTASYWYNRHLGILHWRRVDTVPPPSLFASLYRALEWPLSLEQCLLDQHGPRQYHLKTHVSRLFKQTVKESWLQNQHLQICKALGPWPRGGVFALLTLGSIERQEQHESNESAFLRLLASTMKPQRLMNGDKEAILQILMCVIRYSYCKCSYALLVRLPWMTQFDCNLPSDVKGTW